MPSAPTNKKNSTQLLKELQMKMLKLEKNFKQIKNDFESIKDSKAADHYLHNL